MFGSYYKFILVKSILILIWVMVSWLAPKIYIPFESLCIKVVGLISDKCIALVCMIVFIYIIGSML